MSVDILDQAKRRQRSSSWLIATPLVDLRAAAVVSTSTESLTLAPPALPPRAAAMADKVQIAQYLRELADQKEEYKKWKNDPLRLQRRAETIAAAAATEAAAREGRQKLMAFYEQLRADRAAEQAAADAAAEAADAEEQAEIAAAAAAEAAEKRKRTRTSQTKTQADKKKQKKQKRS